MLVRGRGWGGRLCEDCGEDDGCEKMMAEGAVFE